VSFIFFTFKTTYFAGYFFNNKTLKIVKAVAVIFGI